MSRVREISWPEEFSDLKRIEESMICGICYEYMETTVMTPCSHNYCSLCIRKYLHYKAQCPACFNVFYEKDLYINRIMDVFIQHYVNVKEKLVSLIENRTVYNTIMQQEPEPISISPMKPIKNDFRKSPKVSEQKLSEPKTPSINSSFMSTSKCDTFSPDTNLFSKCDASSPSTSRSQKVIPSIAKIFNTPKRKENTMVQSVTNIKSVSCPVCSVDISENHINVHLDACLKRETGQKAAKAKRVTAKRPPLPKLVLRVMKDAELRKKMKELGLPTHGDRKGLETRFTRYSTIYNAECDKIDPRPIPDLIRQCEMEEKQERKMDLFLVSTAPTARLQIEKNAQEEKIEEAQKTYRQANKSNFDKLIEEVRNRKKQTEMDEQSVSSISKPSSSVNTVVNIPEYYQDSKGKTRFNSTNEIVFNESDSDESCPLQHYTNVIDSSPSNSTIGSPMKRPKVNTKSNSEIKGALSLQKIFNNPYEASTDESGDETIENNSKEDKNSNHSSLYISQKSMSDMTVTSNLINSVATNSSADTRARNLRNSIINDFSFDDISDDSSNEFSNKPQGVEETKSVSKNSMQKKKKNICDTKVHEELSSRTILGDVLNNSNDDFLFDNINDNSFEFVNTSIVGAKDVHEKKIDKTSEPQNCNPTKVENNISSSNENCQPLLSPGCRPIRKRNRPLRYADSHGSKKDDEDISNFSTDDLLVNYSPKSLKSHTFSEGSLKRRRCKSKVNLTDQTIIDLQNPPKRPVRRR